MSLNQLLETKMLGALELANPVAISSSSGVLSLTPESNSFVAEGTEAITSIVGGEVTQGIYVVTWNTVRTLIHNAAALRLVGQSSRITMPGDSGVYQINGLVTTELAYMPIVGHAEVDHVHEVATYEGNGFLSSEDKIKLDGIEAGAQVNQEAFAYVKVGQSTISADTEKDMLELTAGTNITIIPDTTYKKVTIAVDGKVGSAETADTAGSVAWNNVFDKPSTYPPPVATSAILGGIKQGNGISIAADGTASVNVTSIVPAGVIVMWSGSVVAIPSGWTLCNGSNGAPDLRDRFIVGAGNSYGVGATGGEAMHGLSVAEMPSHYHSAAVPGIYGGAWGAGFSNYGFLWVNGENSGTSSASTTYTGGGVAHENRPPYYALAYIMKL